MESSAKPPSGVENLVVFDGVCNICDGWVQFIIRNDKGGKFYFTSAQSRTGAALLESYGYSSVDIETMLFLRNGKCHTKSDSVIEIFAALGGWRRAALLLLKVPKRLRDFFYTAVARNRYRIAGRRQSCRIPAPSVAARFIL